MRSALCCAAILLIGAAEAVADEPPPGQARLLEHIGNSANVSGLMGARGIAHGQDAPIKPDAARDENDKTEPEKPACEPLISLPNAKVEVPWAEFRRLLEQIEPKEPEEPVKRPAVDWTISEAKYDAVAQSTGVMQLRGAFSITVWAQDAWVMIPILGDEVALEGARLNGERQPLLAGERGWLTLQLEEPGDYELEVDFYVSISGEEGDFWFSFRHFGAPQTSMTLSLPEPQAKLDMPDASIIEQDAAEERLTARLAFPRTEQVRIMWTVPPPEEIEAEPEPLRLAAESATLVTVAERFLEVKTRIQYTVLRGETREFIADLPAQANVHAVEGRGAQWSREDKDDAQRIIVRTNHDVDEAYELALAYEIPIEIDEGAAVLQGHKLPGLVREQGHMALAVRGNVEVRPGPELHNLTRVDVSAVPEAMAERAAHPVLFAFRYTEAPHRLTLELERLDDVGVRVAAIESGTIETVVTEEGLEVNRARYTLRNTERQFLRLTLPKGAEVWGAEVAGRPVKPAKGNGEEEILLPLIASNQGRFEAQLIYALQVADASDFLRRPRFDAPVADILADRLTWIVYLPEERRVRSAQGDFRMRQTPRQAALAGLMSRVATDHEEARVFALREGVERFLITDINAPAASAGASREARYKGEPHDAGEPVQREPLDQTIAGVLPVSIELPVTGQPYHFERALAPQGQRLHLELNTYSARWLQAGLALVVLGGIAAGVGAGLALMRIEREIREFSPYVRAGFGFGAGAVFIALALLAPWFGGPFLAGAAVTAGCRLAMAANKRNSLASPEEA